MENSLMMSKKAELLRRLQAHSVEKKPFEEACVILVDRSGSMSDPSGNETKISAVKRCIPFLSCPGRYISYALIGFEDWPTVIVSPTTSFSNIQSGVDFLVPRGGTNFTQAIREGLKTFLELKEIPERKRMILLSDGRHNAEQSELGGMIDKCVEMGVVVDTLGFGADADVSLLQEIARRTGGKFQFVDSPLALEHAYRKLNFTVRWIEHK